MFRLLCIFLTTACVSANQMPSYDDNDMMAQLMIDCDMDDCGWAPADPAHPANFCSFNGIVCAEKSIISINLVEAQAPWCVVSQRAMDMITAANVTFTGCQGKTWISSCMMCPPCKIPHISVELPRISLSLLLHIKYYPLVTDLFDILRDLYIHASITIDEFDAISMIRQVLITDLDH